MSKLRNLLEEFKKWNNKEFCLKKVKQNGLNLKYVHKQTKEICMAAVMQNGWALQYVHPNVRGYREICMAAVEQQPTANMFVHRQDIIEVIGFSEELAE